MASVGGQGPAFVTTADVHFDTGTGSSIPGLEAAFDPVTDVT